MYKSKVVAAIMAAVVLSIFQVSCGGSYTAHMNNNTEQAQVTQTQKLQTQSTQSQAMQTPIITTTEAKTHEPTKTQNIPKTQEAATQTPVKTRAPATQTTVKTQTPAITPSPEKTPDTVRVLIPEGYSVSQIGDALEANGVCKKADFLNVINTYDFSYYPLVASIKSFENRAFKLEGYLFPDTYEFYRNMKPQDAVGVMLRNTEKKIGDKYSYPGMTTDEIITLASIIEKEAFGKEEMGKISSVFHNRLKIKMKLQADVTIFYIEKYVKPNLTGDVNRYNSYYNTYKTAALPAGPICNPGAAALEAAVNPETTEFLFFLTDKSNKYYYAKTYEEHKKNAELAGIN